MSLALLAFRNVTRNKVRTALTMLGVALTVMAFVTLRTILSSWTIGPEHAAADRLVTTNRMGFVFKQPRAYMDAVRAVPGVTAVTSETWFDGRDPRKPDFAFASFAVDPEAHLRVFGEIDLPPAQRRQWIEDRQGAVVGDLLAEQLNVRIGDRITLSGTLYPGDWPFRIVGIYGTKKSTFERTLFLFHWSYLNEKTTGPKERVGWIHSTIADPTRGSEIAAAIDRSFAGKAVETHTVNDEAMRLGFVQMAGAILATIDGISLVLLVLLGLILGNTGAMGVRERYSEYGALRAIGFRPRHVRRLVIAESVTIGTMAGLLGVALSYPIVQLGLGGWLLDALGDSLGRSYFATFEIELRTVIVAVGLSIALGFAAGVLPARKAGGMPVSEALRSVE